MHSTVLAAHAKERVHRRGLKHYQKHCTVRNLLYNYAYSASVKRVLCHKGAFTTVFLLLLLLAFATQWYTLLVAKVIDNKFNWLQLPLTFFLSSHCCMRCCLTQKLTTSSHTSINTVLSQNAILPHVIPSGDAKAPPPLSMFTSSTTTNTPLRASTCSTFSVHYHVYE
jgi:hypothetical protein